MAALELALACDFIYASETAKLGLPEVTLGIMPGFGGSQKFARLLGRNRANELIFTGKILTAAEAKEWGIVNAVFPAGELVAKAMETAAKIAGNGMLGVLMPSMSSRAASTWAKKMASGMRRCCLPPSLRQPIRKKGCKPFWRRENRFFQAPEGLRRLSR